MKEAQLRHFGLTLGMAFAAIALYRLWREATASATLFGIIALVLLVAAAVAPRSLRLAHRLWMGLAERLGRFTTAKGTAHDRGAPEPSYWKLYPAAARGPKHYETLY
ncbi:MAG: hypothetical protein ACXW2F_01325 [Thermoanaerobaculia bacterium]